MGKGTSTSRVFLLPNFRTVRSAFIYESTLRHSAGSGWRRLRLPQRTRGVYPWTVTMRLPSYPDDYESLDLVAHWILWENYIAIGPAMPPWKLISTQIAISAFAVCFTLARLSTSVALPETEVTWMTQVPSAKLYISKYSFLRDACGPWAKTLETLCSGMQRRDLPLEIRQGSSTSENGSRSRSPKVTTASALGIWLKALPQL